MGHGLLNDTEIGKQTRAILHSGKAPGYQARQLQLLKPCCEPPKVKEEKAPAPAAPTEPAPTAPAPANEGEDTVTVIRKKAVTRTRKKAPAKRG